MIDDDKIRMDNDYYDAKRYIGFLISNEIIEKCEEEQKDHSGKNCFNWLLLCDEFQEYLISISSEEFIRIKAFLKWGKVHNWENITDQRLINKYYFDCLNELDSTRRNCMKRDHVEIFNNIPGNAKKYFLDFVEEYLTKIISAKVHTGERLNKDIEKEVKEYIFDVYPKMKDSLINSNFDKEDAKALLSLMYKNTYIPNMYEYIFKCYICSFLTTEEHNLIRDQFHKPHIN